ncbi:pre-mRNA-splicing factor 38A isoform X1 [Oreochromis aureus]|uniref:pre-mRNA-splicing factor 38A isoform X1 n=1 Tax=Oreochromis aureus TaxID=47969 RepID=UPI0019537713|nr:pre-mRNA-splicing factor 38A isoform X1 [Oreochromis aureus]
MANRTVKDANSIHGTNPQYLVEKIIRTRIYESKYWKEECFGLTAELVVDKAMELKFVGGVFGGNIKPTPFLCLTLKMLQIQPEKDIIVEFIKNEDFKYVRLLGAMYMRLTGTAVDCYKYLEPLYNDYRKIKSQNRNGEFEVMHVDEFIDGLLQSERMCDVILPRLQKRQVLEEAEMLDPRISALEEDLDEVESSEEEDEEEDKVKKWREFRLLSLIDVVTVTMTDLVAPHHHVTDAAVLPDGGAGLQRGEAPHHGETAIAAKAPGATAAGPERDATAPNPQVTTEATDIAAIPSPQRGVQKRVTRRVEEETSDFCFSFCFYTKLSEIWFLIPVFLFSFPLLLFCGGGGEYKCIKYFM